MIDTDNRNSKEYIEEDIAFVRRLKGYLKSGDYDGLTIALNSWEDELWQMFNDKVQKL